MGYGPAGVFLEGFQGVSRGFRLGEFREFLFVSFRLVRGFAWGRARGFQIQNTVPHASELCILVIVSIPWGEYWFFPFFFLFWISTRMNRRE